MSVEEFVTVIPRTHMVFEMFHHNQIFLPTKQSLWSPEEIVGSSTIRHKEGLLVDPFFLQIWPSAMLCCNGKIYTYWDKNDVCRIWMGGNLVLDDLKYGNKAIRNSLERNLTRFMRIVSAKLMYLLGFLCSRSDPDQNAFAFLYAIQVGGVYLKDNKYVKGKWMTMAELKKVYSKLDSWSKRVFDHLYEHPSARERLELYQKYVKN